MERLHSGSQGRTPRRLTARCPQSNPRSSRVAWLSWPPARPSPFRRALADAGNDFDLSHVNTVLDRWWGIAAVCANPLTEQERKLVTQARAGVDTGWYVRKNGSWVRL
ncbi:MAG TPA: DUF6247 family protein [Pseudonocardiaceae bacterium]|nr:DUF6247 family protein [Pseudonocardiaceae bacterium]